jgi:dolichol-phosphate mannosyltransferase
MRRRLFKTARFSAVYGFGGFSVGGALGVLTHLFLLNVFYTVGLAFLLSYFCSALMVATQNYFLNQYLTFSDSRLKFSFSSTRLFFYLASNLINLIANTSIATLLFDISGLLSLSSISGIIVGIIWNYTMARLILKQ